MYHNKDDGCHLWGGPGPRLSESREWPISSTSPGTPRPSRSSDGETPVSAACSWLFLGGVEGVEKGLERFSLHLGFLGPKIDTELEKEASAFLLIDRKR